MKTISIEQRRKISKSLTGRKLTEEHKNNISKANINEKNSFWKGGTKKFNKPLYETFYYKLVEESRCTKEGYLEVKCAYCGKWHNPSYKSILHRITSINGKEVGENRLYCSKECKSNCPIYRQRIYPKGFKIATSREVQPELRQMVFERDNWTCLKCGAINNLHCHHIEGIVQNPLMSADVDLCITLCKNCHKEVHKQKDCRYYDLRKKSVIC
jgi:hypothetical protein